MKYSRHRYRAFILGIKRAGMKLSKFRCAHCEEEVETLGTERKGVVIVKNIKCPFCEKTNGVKVTIDECKTFRNGG
ncbi:hypothetical protein [Dickeya phage Sucellus]|nr:hypothetical protein [Dickeya phage Sucellus]